MPGPRRPALLRLALPLLLLVGCGAEDGEVRPAERSAGAPGAATTETARTEQPSPPTTADPTRIAVLGDSLAAGYGLPREAAFPARLEEMLRERGYAVEVLNAGVSGDTTAGGLARLDWVLSSDPELLIVELGGNDGLRGMPPEATEENLRAIVEGARAAGVEVLLLAIRLPPNYGREYIERFEAIYPRLGEELGVTVVPFFLEGVAGVPELNLGDALHPNAEGQRRAAGNLLPWVEGELSESPHPPP